MRPLLALVTLTAAASAADPPARSASLFNGRDLAGWVNVNCAPNTFRVADGEIITNGLPTGFLRTDKQYENFTLSFDWMHTNTKEVGNSGLFVWGDALPAVGTGYTRGIEVQVLVNLDKPGYYTSHGDLFSIWGASCKPVRPHPNGMERCLPSERRCKGGGEWNHYDVTGKDGVITLGVNGKVVSEVRDCKPRKGYLALESEGAECRFKNFVFAELPSTNPTPAEVATADRGHKSLYTGIDLTGWTADSKAWQEGEVLRCTGTTPLTSAAPLARGELVFDWKLPAKGGDTLTVTAGGTTHTSTGKPATWHRATLPVGPGPLAIPAVAGLELRNLFFKSGPAE